MLGVLPFVDDPDLSGSAAPPTAATLRCVLNIVYCTNWCIVQLHFLCALCMFICDGLCVSAWYWIQTFSAVCSTFKHFYKTSNHHLQRLAMKVQKIYNLGLVWGGSQWCGFSMPEIFHWSHCAGGSICSVHFGSAINIILAPFLSVSNCTCG